MEDAELFSTGHGQADWNDDFLQSSDVTASQKQSLLTIKQREAGEPKGEKRSDEQKGFRNTTYSNPPPSPHLTNI